MEKSKGSRDGNGNSLTILPVATAFYVCEAFGFEAGIDKKWKEAPQFYWLYTFIIIIGAGIILFPNAPLVNISLWSQRINGILLPIVLICMMLIINKKVLWESTPISYSKMSLDG